MYDIALFKATDGIEELLKTSGRSSYWLVADVNLCSDSCNMCRRLWPCLESLDDSECGGVEHWFLVRGIFSAESLLELVQLSAWVPRIYGGVRPAHSHVTTTHSQKLRSEPQYFHRQYESGG